MATEPAGVVCEAKNGRKTFEPPVLCVVVEEVAELVEGVEVVRVVEGVKVVEEVVVAVLEGTVDEDVVVVDLDGTVVNPGMLVGLVAGAVGVLMARS